MLSRQSFVKIVLAGTGAAVAGGLVPATAFADDLPPGAIGKHDHIHIEPPHDPNTPIVHDVQFESYYDGASYAAGPLSFTMMPSGDWTFSGQLHDGPIYTETKQFLKFDAYCALTICIGVKDSLGTTIAFKHEGKLNFGTPYIFNKSGNSKVIKDNWKYYVQKHSWYGAGAAILTATHPKSSSSGGGVSAGDVVGDVIGVVGIAAAFL